MGRMSMGSVFVCVCREPVCHGNCRATRENRRLATTCLGAGAHRARASTLHVRHALLAAYVSRVRPVAFCPARHSATRMLARMRFVLRSRSLSRRPSFERRNERSSLTRQ